MAGLQLKLEMFISSVIILDLRLSLTEKQQTQNTVDCASIQQDFLLNWANTCVGVLKTASVETILKEE